MKEKRPETCIKFYDEDLMMINYIRRSPIMAGDLDTIPAMKSLVVFAIKRLYDDIKKQESERAKAQAA